MKPEKSDDYDYGDDGQKKVTVVKANLFATVGPYTNRAISPGKRPFWKVSEKGTYQDK
jgi:hypothetical protein